MIPCHPIRWRERTAPRERASATRALRLVPADAARTGDERRRTDADDAREFNPYGLMAWWPQA
jgi:hypothetical protein